MSATFMDGALLAGELRNSYKARVAELAREGVVAGLGTILVGDDGPSANYVAMKHRDCEEIGIASFGRHLPSSATHQEVLEAVREMNHDPRVDAFLVQVPLPSGLPESEILAAVSPDKDVDGLHPMNLGRLALGRPGPLPCTPAGIVALLQHYDVTIEGREVVIIGRGLTIGRPLSLLMSLNCSGGNAAVTVVHSKVPNLASIVQRADIVIAAVGVPGIVTAAMVKEGAVVVGAGTSFQGKRLLSDLADDVADVASLITPRIGGVGPMTRAMLLSNTIDAAARRAK
ncbi:MAG: bifunctional 5,10-methylenetetrahydrofolate dehydrogenase/5,10-methenyltetrahydrofolate cyclohydrolase [Acidimicrobiales bacterium]